MGHPPGVASLEIDGDDLVVRLRPLERVGALHGDVRAPLRAVADVEASDRPFAPVRGIRAPGTGIPGVVALGTWRRPGAKDFLALRRGQPAVVVRLRGHAFDRLLVSTGEADAVAAAIRRAVRRGGDGGTAGV